MDLFDLAAIAKSNGTNGIVSKNDKDSASAIKPVVFGENIHIQDSSNKHLSGMQLFGRTQQKTTIGKNLFDASAIGEYTKNGITFKYLGDGKISVKGTTTTSLGETRPVPLNLPTGKYYVSLNSNVNVDHSIVTFMLSYEHNGTRVWKNSATEITAEDTNQYAYISVGRNETIDIVVQPQIELGEKATPAEPYTGGKPSPSPDYPQEMVNVGDKGSIEVQVMGKNLLGERYYYGFYSSGIFTIRNTNKVDFPYSPTGESSGVCKIFNCKKGVSYTFSVKNPNKNWAIGIAEYEKFYAAFAAINATSHINVSDATTVLEYTAKTDGVLVCGIAGRWTDGKTTTHECTETEWLQLEISEQATSYEPYAAQTLALSTPNGLPGVPVSTGGNYTDENGQQWVCDEIDLSRGVYVKRVAEHIFDDGDTFGISTNLSDTFNRFSWITYIDMAKIETPIICETMRYIGLNCGFVENTIYGSYNNARCFMVVGKEIDTVEKFKEKIRGTKIQYILATPIETPLSADELSTYKALHTNYPITNIFNDVNASMEVTYTADTEKHIETNYVSKAIYDALEERVAALEQHATS